MVNHSACRLASHSPRTILIRKIAKAPGRAGAGSASGSLPLQLCQRVPQRLVHFRRGVAAHLLSEACRADIGRGYRNGHRRRAADRPLNPGEQLIDLPTVVTSHGNVKFMHSLTSTRLQAARPAAGGARAATG
jgi:hypothetical protein